MPLTGLKVLELANILAGPMIGQFCAELGADVVKIEVGSRTRDASVRNHERDFEVTTP